MDRDVKALAALLGVAGLAHFVRPEPFERIVPKALPRKRDLVLASGAVEIGSAALLARPRTRRTGGVLAAGLLVGVFPANVQMAIDVIGSPKASGWFKVGTMARLPLQVPLIRTALKAAREGR